MGPELMERMKRHAERFGTEAHLRPRRSRRARRAAVPSTGGNGEYTCDALIIATGASAKYLGLRPRTRSRAAACPRARPATASSSRTSTSRSSAAATRPSRKRCTCRTSRRSVTVVHRRDEFRAEQIMIRTSCSSAAAPATSRSSGTTCSTRSSATMRGVTGRAAQSTKNGSDARHRRCTASSSRSATRRTPTCSKASSRWKAATSSLATGRDGIATATSVDGRVRSRRRRRSDLSPGGHVGGLRLHGGARRRAFFDRRLIAIAALAPQGASNRSLLPRRLVLQIDG